MTLGIMVTIDIVIPDGAPERDAALALVPREKAHVAALIEREVLAAYYLSADREALVGGHARRDASGGGRRSCGSFRCSASCARATSRSAERGATTSSRATRSCAGA